MGRQLPAADQRDGMSAVNDAVRYLERKGVRRGASVWANVTVTFKGCRVLDDDRMTVQLRFDGTNMAQVALYWSEYSDDEDEAVRERMHQDGLYGYVDHRWQKIRFIEPNTIYIEDPALGYVYDVTLTFEQER